MSCCGSKKKFSRNGSETKKTEVDVTYSGGKSIGGGFTQNTSPNAKRNSTQGNNAIPRRRI